MSYLRRIASVTAGVVRHRELRRVELAFFLFNGVEWGEWLAMLVYAYNRGGATTAGLVALAQLIPCAVFAPWTSGLADRHRPIRVLQFAYVAQALGLALLSVAILLGASSLLVYAIAVVTAPLYTLQRPTQAVLIPGLVRAPDELTAANVVSGWIESVSLLVAPAVTGALLAIGSPGLVFAVMAGLMLGALALVLPVAGPAAAAAAGGSAEDRPGKALEAFRLLARNPESRLLVTLLGAESAAIGALDVLYVVLAISVLHIGNSGAGYLNAAFGAGGVLAIGATITLVGRRHLMPPLILGALAWGGAFLLLGVRPQVAVAFALLILAGGGRIVVDVAGRTALQRIAPLELLSRVFGVVEGVGMAGLAVGSVLTPVLVGLAGARWAVVGVGAMLPLLLLVTARRLRAIDEHATVPVVELGLLRALAIFSALRAPELETLARELRPVAAAVGEAVVREGDEGDLFYVIADGDFEVSVGGKSLRMLSRGESFGEIALLRSVPRTATVTARTAGHLYALGKDAFIGAVTAYAPVAAEASRVADQRLAAGRATITP